MFVFKKETLLGKNYTSTKKPTSHAANSADSWCYLVKKQALINPTQLQSFVHFLLPEFHIYFLLHDYIYFLLHD